MRVYCSVNYLIMSGLFSIKMVLHHLYLNRKNIIKHKTILNDQIFYDVDLLAQLVYIPYW